MGPEQRSLRRVEEHGGEQSGGLALARARQGAEIRQDVRDRPRSDAPKTIYRNRSDLPTVEVHSVRTALRRDARGATVTDIVVEVTQRRRGYFEQADQVDADSRRRPFRNDEDGDFKFRAGCTIVIDATENVFRHIIRTPGDVASDVELERVRAFVSGESAGDSNAFDGRQARKPDGAAAARTGRAVRDPAPPFGVSHGQGVTDVH